MVFFFKFVVRKCRRVMHDCRSSAITAEFVRKRIYAPSNTKFFKDGAKLLTPPTTTISKFTRTHRPLEFIINTHYVFRLYYLGRSAAHQTIGTFAASARTLFAGRTLKP